MKPTPLDRVMIALFTSYEYDGAPQELPPLLEQKRVAQTRIKAENKPAAERKDCIRCHLDARSYHVYHGLELFCIRCFIAELDR